VKIALAQINPILGDFAFNKQKILDYWHLAVKDGADIALFPELAICGYNPEDLVLRKAFREAAERVLAELVEASKDFTCAIIVGNIARNGDDTTNSAFLIHQGEIIHRHDKFALPNYGVFDEKRIFTAGNKMDVATFKGKKLAIMSCEDIWCYSARGGDGCAADLILVINASPFSTNKHDTRLAMLRATALAYNSHIIYLNMVGGQDSIVYDGGSMVMDPYGNLLHQSVFFEESLEMIVIASTCEAIQKKNGLPRPVCNTPGNDDYALIYQALLLALRDYMRKNSMTDVVLGLSGGIDSALTAALAIDALGKDRVHLVTLPSRYSSPATFKDTEEFLTLISKKAESISIEAMFEVALKLTSLQRRATDSDAAIQNLQSRIRGMILMALSNQYGYMLLSTGNKSELAAGYATLYGDMNGGYNLLKDLYKTDVYALARFRNKQTMVIPESILTKAPSAELSFDQKDSDNLPEYEILDQILYNYIEESKSRLEIIVLGFEPETVDKVLKLIRMAEFKRHQSTLGPKIRNMSFDLDWRYPITNKFWH
jgi:NAD+ synthetase